MNLITVYLPEIVCLVGLALFVFARADQPKTQEAGKIMFFAGLLATLLTGVHHP